MRLFKTSVMLTSNFEKSEEKDQYELMAESVCLT